MSTITSSFHSTAATLPPKRTETSTSLTSLPKPPEAPSPDPVTSLDAVSSPPQQRGLKFYTFLLSIALTGLLVSLEATVVSTALPSIIADLGGTSNYVWISLAYFLTVTAPQPLVGSLSTIYGRRNPLLASVLVFVLGSGLCGGASSITMLIAGRAVQGLGAGGVNVLIETVICDIILLRERGKFMALVFSMITIGTALGPVFAGLIVQYSTWRWVFYLNLPVGGVAFVLLALFLKVKSGEGQAGKSFGEKMARLDILGNVIFIASCVSALLALGWADAVYPWSSFRIILPLILGFAGFGVFLRYEGSGYAADPTMPLHLFANRTSLVAFLLTFFHGLLTVYVLYFLPVYFQGVLMSSPGQSGVQLLPTVLVMIPFAAAGGGMLTKVGKYKPVHMIGYGVMVLGFGLYTLLDENSSTAEWVVYQAVESVGAGLVVGVLLPAIQAKLTDADTAKSTATFGFVRDFVKSLDAASGARHQVVGVFVESLKRTWQVGIVFTGVAFLLTFLEESVELRKDLDTKYGMENLKEETAKENV
ncbi:MFS general substrate transporter [Mytilinidion resinicola]|uniref:MFS general substrate transporter n=1 Tax=Mytilinidion resinicola TaxID=574789 RepID=A0A6A6Z498_9PEZI|nr:MFS general substrate transporter [Mytilinidion resinicola]KAF2815559.1 MFS general substrate transporter [Mytilinidion resinicola]